MTLIPLGPASAPLAHAVIDDDDTELVTSYGRWRLSNKGYGYVYAFEPVSKRPRPLLIHRLILGLPLRSDGRECDHINRNPLDNRKVNLRIVTHAANMQNRPSQRNSTSKYRNVYWDSARDRWRVQLRADGLIYRLGRYDDEDEAGKVAREARLRLMPFATD